MKALIEQGPDFLMELFRMAMNEAMKMERESFLNAGAYERSKNRLDYANGFKPKTLNTRSGPVTFAIPQTRNSGFYPQALQKGLRSERALTLAMAEMYVQGVSTRKVKNILEKMCGLEVSSTQVSDAAKTLDEEIRLFMERSLGCYSVLYVDAEYQRVRMNGSVVDAAVFPAVPWQRCYFHLCQNAQAYARKIEEKKEIARTMRNIFSHANKASALMALRGAVQYWGETKKHPNFAEWMEEKAYLTEKEMEKSAFCA